MRIKFTQIPEKLNYPPSIRGKLSTIHSSIVSYVVDNFSSQMKYKSSVVNIMNYASYYVISGDAIPKNWSPDKPFDNMLSKIEDAILQKTLKDIYLHTKDIEWDLTESELEDGFIKAVGDKYELESESSTNIVATAIPTTVPNSSIKQLNNAVYPDKFTKVEHTLTPKEHLYIQPPKVPQMDVNKPFVSRTMNNSKYVIYTSLPEIPQNQSQISVTTDVNKMTDLELLKLFPNHTIRTRSADMYKEYPNMITDELLGVIFPISGFSENQVRENIIKYPHLFKLQREIDGEITSFYNNIEIDGSLFNTLEIWDTLPEASIIPRNSDFIKEYVVRRYLLERDINGVNHKYPIFGTLTPFLTLFTTQSIYSDLGYNDPVSLARTCVESRVSYKQSRNPILRMVNNNG